MITENEMLHSRFPAHPETHQLGIDNDGYLFAHDLDEVGLMWRITECCGASAKGGGDGVVCRGCYEYIEDEYCLEPAIGLPRGGF